MVGAALSLGREAERMQRVPERAVDQLEAVEGSGGSTPERRRASVSRLMSAGAVKAWRAREPNPASMHNEVPPMMTSAWVTREAGRTSGAAGPVSPSASRLAGRSVSAMSPSSARLRALRGHALQMQRERGEQHPHMRCICVLRTPVQARPELPGQFGEDWRHGRACRPRTAAHSDPATQPGCRAGSAGRRISSQAISAAREFQSARGKGGNGPEGAGLRSAIKPIQVEPLRWIAGRGGARAKHRSARSPSRTAAGCGRRGRSRSPRH